jgi:hypothetical protein
MTSSLSLSSSSRAVVGPQTVDHVVAYLFAASSLVKRRAQIWRDVSVEEVT